MLLLTSAQAAPRLQSARLRVLFSSCIAPRDGGTSMAELWDARAQLSSRRPGAHCSHTLLFHGAHKPGTVTWCEVINPARLPAQSSGGLQQNGSNHHDPIPRWDFLEVQRTEHVPGLSIP